MASILYGTIWNLLLFIPSLYCSPIKRSTKQQATDCYGTDCFVDLDAPSISQVALSENLTGAIITALPNMEDAQNKMVVLLEKFDKYLKNMTTSAGAAWQRQDEQLHKIANDLQRQVKILNERLPPPPRDYVNGFGSPEGEYWAGLKQIHCLTKNGSWILRVDLEDFEGSKTHAQYQSFQVGDAASQYRLSLGTYDGTAGDSLSGHNTQAFSTKDNDNDRANLSNCAESFKGAWWHRSCYASNLNGLYLESSQKNNKGMVWYYWKNNFEVMKSSSMKMRRVQ